MEGFPFDEFKEMNQEIEKLKLRNKKLEEILGSIQGNAYVVSFPDADAIEEILKDN